MLNFRKSHLDEMIESNPTENVFKEYDTNRLQIDKIGLALKK